MIVRVNKTSNYTVISNNVFKDQNLSLKAKGLLTTILSLPDNWKYSIEGLTRLCADGRNTVATAINELIEAGYIVRTQKFDEAGKFSGYIYDIYEEIPPKIADLSYAEKPFTEKPFTENQQELNTNISNTNILNTNNIDSIPPISPLENLFEEFWKAYPSCKRKVDKQGCKRKFLKIENLETIFPDIMASLEMWKREWAKEKNEYVPLTSKWINQQYWTVKDMRTETQIKIADVVKENSNDFLI